MRIVISGASGMIGSALTRLLSGAGHEVVGLTRGRREGWIHWDPAAGVLDAEALEGADAVVHLAGLSLDRRWSDGVKRRLWTSRVDSSRLLATTVSRLRTPPRVYVTASAVGWYGDRGEAVLDESSSRGDGFLADLCEAWEDAARPAASAQTRVVAIRTGVVLESLTSRLRLPFSLGLGARIGPGNQWLSWILLEDLCHLYAHVIHAEDAGGPVNAVAPGPVTNAAFTRGLARALGRPAFLVAPGFAFELVYGAEMARSTLLASQRAVPARALAGGFEFVAPDLDAALPRALGRPLE